MREQDAPGVTEPLMESDRSCSGLCFKIGRDAAETKTGWFSGHGECMRVDGDGQWERCMKDDIARVRPSYRVGGGLSQSMASVCRQCFPRIQLQSNGRVLSTCPFVPRLRLQAHHHPTTERYPAYYTFADRGATQGQDGHTCTDEDIDTP